MQHIVSPPFRSHNLSILMYIQDIGSNINNPVFDFVVSRCVLACDLRNVSLFRCNMGNCGDYAIIFVKFDERHARGPQYDYTP